MIVNDPFLGTLSKSHKNAKRGIVPGVKSCKNSLDDILGDNVENIEILEKEDKKEKSAWEKLKLPRGFVAMNKPVEQWTSEQLFFHFCKIFTEKYAGVKVSTATASGIEFMKTLKEDLKKELHLDPSPIFIKSYLEWFVKGELDSIISKKGKFIIQDIRNKKMYRKFNSEYKVYDFSEDSVQVEVKNVEKTTISMDALFDASRVNFISEYGVVITFFWLIKNKKCTEKEAKDIIMRIMKDIVKDGEFAMKKVIDITRGCSPYPISYDIVYLKELLLQLNIDSVSFANNVKERF